MENELKTLKEKNRLANVFIKTIAVMLDIETDGLGYDGLTLSIEDFEDAIVALKKNNNKVTQIDNDALLVGKSEQCILHSTDWYGKCFKCGEQVFTRNKKCDNWMPSKGTSGTRCSNCGKDRWEHDL